MVKMLVIADDLTGALDTGVQFAQRGARVCVATTPDTNVEDCDVVVVNTGSRHDAPDLAASKVRTAIRCFREAQMFYKKTDSVLRGNIASELAAFREELGPVAFVPFYPKQGRTTVKGIQYVNGVPVDQSSFRNDPLNPVLESDINKLLSGTSDITVYSGETDEDLVAIAKVLRQTGQIRVTAGCAGFAPHLPLDVPVLQIDKKPIAQPLFVLSGSVNAATLAQIVYAKAHGIAVYVPTTAQLMGQADANGIINSCIATLNAGQPVVLASAAGDERIPSSAGLQQRMTEWASAIVAQVTCPYTPFIVGGDLLAVYLQSYNMQCITPQHEIADGVVLCTHGQSQFITKSGGFGAPDLLATLMGRE